MKTRHKIKLSIISAIIPLAGISSFAVDKESQVIINDQVELTQEEINAIKILAKGKILVLGEDGKVFINKEISVEQQRRDAGALSEINSSVGGWCF